MVFSSINARKAFVYFILLIMVVSLADQWWATSELGGTRSKFSLFSTYDFDPRPLTEISINQGIDGLLDTPTFEETCEFWLKEVDEWKSYADDWAHSRGYSGKGVLIDQRNGGGGDLLVGTMAGLIEAITERTKLFLLAPDFMASFDVSDALPKDMIELVDAANIPSTESYDSCHIPHFSRHEKVKRLEFTCDFNLHEKYGCYHYRWFCMKKGVAKRLISENTVSTTPVHAIGCPMRLFYSMSKAQALHNISWIDAGIRTQGTFGALLEKVKQYRTIALHFRGGDEFFNIEEGVETEILSRVNDAVLCAHSVAGMIEDYFQADSEIRFIVSSDTPMIRDMLLDAFPKNVIMIEEQPSHFEDIRSAQKQLDMFAEWFLLGQADLMIQNIFKTWPSSFSTTARLYHLKSDYFEVPQEGGMCVWKDYDYKGNLNLVEEKLPKPSPRQQLQVKSCRKRFSDKSCAQKGLENKNLLQRLINVFYLTPGSA